VHTQRHWLLERPASGCPPPFRACLLTSTRHGRRPREPRKVYSCLLRVDGPLPKANSDAMVAFCEFYLPSPGSIFSGEIPGHHSLRLPSLHREFADLRTLLHPICGAAGPEEPSPANRSLCSDLPEHPEFFHWCHRRWQIDSSISPPLSLSYHDLSGSPGGKRKTPTNLCRC
jgi:hypothetical protein